MDLRETIDLLEKSTNDISTIRKLVQLSYPLTVIYLGVPLRKWARRKLGEVSSKKERIENGLNQLVQQSSQKSLVYLESIQKQDTYLVYCKAEKVLGILNRAQDDLVYLKSRRRFFDESFNNKVCSAVATIAKVRTEIEGFNAKFIAQRKVQYAWLWNKASNSLDDDQKTAIITDDTHNLVIAGAGAGKTEVLITRIAYLLERKPDGVKPERILALAYQTEAAKEIRKRLKDTFHVDVGVKTFHALGLEILRAKHPETSLMFSGNNSESQYAELIKILFVRLQETKGLRRQILSYLENYQDSEENDETDFEIKEQFYRHMRQRKYTALDRTIVNSEEERAILNFFIAHNYGGQKIRVLYEDPVKWMTKEDASKRNPKPDFFFPDFGVYLEHWGLNKEGKVPEWFDQTTEEYRASMDYKRGQFAANKKKLIEAYSFEFLEEGFFDKLQERFLNAIRGNGKANENVKLELAPYDELVNRVWGEVRELIHTLPDKIGTFIKIAKTNGLHLEAVQGRLNKGKWSKKQKAFANIALRIYEEYRMELSKENKIDFPDMINQAVQELQKPDNGLFRDAFDHILVDEYQDINKQRYELVKELMSINPIGRLFCVGDDWQSIMGFTGSNLDYFVHFEDYFDHPARTYLRINYRSAKSIVNTSSHIIKQNIKRNPGSQLEKDTIANSSQNGSIRKWVSHDRDKSYYYSQMVKHCIDNIQLELKQYPPHEIMILQRIRNYDIMDRLGEYAKAKNIRIGIDGADKDEVPLMTIHGSKGLQAQVVFILDVVKGLKGFPCEIEDPDIFDVAKDTDRKQDKDEEERRLFYVAVTRAKEKVHIYTQRPEESTFLSEIQEHLLVGDLPEPTSS